MAHRGPWARRTLITRRTLIVGTAGLAVITAAVLLADGGQRTEPAPAADPSSNGQGPSPGPSAAAPAAETGEETADPTLPPGGAGTSEPPAAEPVPPEGGSAAGTENGPVPGGADDAAKAAVEQRVLPPAGLGGPSSEHAGVRVGISTVEPVEGVAEGVGEIAGPAIRFTVSVTNDTAGPLTLADAVVTVDAGPDRLPAGELSGPDTSPFPPQAAAGETVTGTYVFQVPLELRQMVRISMNYSPDAPIALFEGSVP